MAIEESVNRILQDYSLVGAIFIAMSSFLYKMWRIVKKDNKDDSFGNEEKDFRVMLLTENKEQKEQNIKLLIEKAELKSEISSLKAQVLFLQDKIQFLTDSRNAP
jgi:hypothetical protein